MKNLYKNEIAKTHTYLKVYINNINIYYKYVYKNINKKNFFLINSIM